MTLSPPNDLLGARIAARDGDDEADDKGMQIESAVDPIGEGGEIVACVLAIVECVVGAGQGRNDMPCWN
jgi:hypothetical protein